MNQEEMKPRKEVVQVRRRRRPFREGIRMPFRNDIPMHISPMVLPGGVAVEHGQKQVADMKNKRENEKKEMQDLNSKLAALLEKIRVLDAENKHLKGRLDVNIDFKFDETKKLYEVQLEDLKALLRENDKKLAELQSKNESLEELVEDLNEQLNQAQDERDGLQVTVDKLHDEISRHIADSEICKRKAGELEKQFNNCKDKCAILNDQMGELRTKLENETTQRLESDKCNVALEDELDFNMDVHKTEIKEYEALIAKLRKQFNVQQVNESDVGNTVAALSAEYENRLQTAIADLQRQHAMEIQLLKVSAKPKGDVTDGKKKDTRMEQSNMLAKMSEYETEIEQLKSKIKFLDSELDLSENQRLSEGENYRSEINDLRVELEAMLKELQNLIDAKLSLELEISAYRTLLEGEENRMGMKQVATAIGGFQTESESALAKALLGTNKMTFHRTTSGYVSVVELENDGKYIKLEDIAKPPKGTTNMKSWTLTQTLESGKRYTHKFTDGNVFSSGKIVKIWGSKHGAGQDGIISSDVAEWAALVMPSTITLKDDKNKEYASLVIKINS